MEGEGTRGSVKRWCGVLFLLPARCDNCAGQSSRQAGSRG